MQKIIEAVKKVIQKIIQKIKEFMENLKRKLSEPSWKMLENKINDLIKKDPAYFGNCTLKIPVAPGSNDLVRFEQSQITIVLNELENTVDTILSACKSTDKRIKIDQREDNVLINQIVQGANKYADDSVILIEDLTNEINDSIAGRGDSVIIRFPEAQNILHRAISLMNNNQKLIKSLENKITSTLRRLDNCPEYCTYIKPAVNKCISAVTKYLNSYVRLSQAQVTSIVSQYKAAITQRKQQSTNIQSNNPNESEVQKTVATQNKASNSQKRNQVTESFYDLYSQIDLI